MNLIKVNLRLYLSYMKLLKTIKKIIQEAEAQYNAASETNTPLEELDRLEKHYRDSLRLLRLYEGKEKNKTNKKN